MFDLMFQRACGVGLRMTFLMSQDLYGVKCFSIDFLFKFLKKKKDLFSRNLL